MCMLLHDCTQPTVRVKAKVRDRVITKAEEGRKESACL
jgi:hypothetical protein